MLHTNRKILRKKLTRKLTLLLSTILVFSYSKPVFALSIEDRIAAQQAMPIQSNAYENWPDGPVVTAESAILIEAETGAILYEKNIHAKQYPASTTKILTALIASEECTMNETVLFSHDAVYGIPRGSNHIAMNEGDTLSMEDCLNAILIRSANEVSYAVAEHIGETWEGFANMMNDRAAALGCVDSNFVNPNGLPDENHYTSAYDLAMIGRAFFANDNLCQITKKPSLRIMKSTGEYIDMNKMELIPGGKYAYEYLVGCKTGYTNDARSSLVSCAEKNGMKLICVVLKEEAPDHYEDTQALFNYGFSNFYKQNVSQAETKYNIDNTGYFYSDNNIFGTSTPLLSLNSQDCIVLPKTVSFQEVDSSISYETDTSLHAAVITYTYNDIYVGRASLDFAKNQEKAYTFDTIDETSENTELIKVEEKKEGKTSFVFINILKVFLYLLLFVGIVFVILCIIVFFRNYKIASRRKHRRRKNSYKLVGSTDDWRKSQIKAAKLNLKMKNKKGRRK